MGFYDLMILCFMISMVFYDFMIEITCLAEPLAPHRPPASRRASPYLRSPGATCLHVSRPAGQHHSGYAPDRRTGCKEHCEHSEQPPPGKS